MLKWVCAVLAMIAFAFNSLLNREALATQLIDPWGFALIRTISGALMLLLLLIIIPKLRKQPTGTCAVSWWGAVSLSTYMLGFSLAYVQLDAGIGALLLFSAVQFTMITYAVLVGKERFTLLQWSMLAAAFTAFVLLVSPANSNLSLGGVVLMVIAGIAWGGYSILGRGVNPNLATRINFLRAAVLLLPICCVAYFFNAEPIWSQRGMLLAITSGAVASALGYSLWYFVVAKIAMSQAAIMQLSVPPIALVLGAWLLHEHLSATTILLSVVILGAILLFTLLRNRS